MITRESFEAWLFSQPDERVFNYQSCTHCVVGTFLRNTTNLQHSLVGPLWFHTMSINEEEEETIFFPKWLVDLLKDARKINLDYILVSTLKHSYHKLFPLDSNLDPSSSNELKEIEPNEGEKTNPSIANTLAVVS